MAARRPNALDVQAVAAPELQLEPVEASVARSLGVARHRVRVFQGLIVQEVGGPSARQAEQAPDRQAGELAA